MDFAYQRKRGLSGVKRFDVTFKGEVLPQHTPEQVKAGFVELFRIQDPAMLEEIFSGKTVVLRSNLDRKTAAEYFVKVNKLGAVVELVPSTARPREPASGSEHIHVSSPFEPHIVLPVAQNDSIHGDILIRKPGQIDKSWPVSAARSNNTPTAKQVPPTEDMEAAIQRRLDQEAARRRAQRMREEEQAAQFKAHAESGDHVLILSNGGFEDIHKRLLKALSGRG